MSLIKKPMLAEKVTDKDALFAKHPTMLATPKLDGIRCVIVDGVPLSRKFKPIPNHHIRETLSKLCAEGMDGEIICPGKTFNETQSLVMSRDGKPEFEFHVFDFVEVGTDLTMGYEQRLNRLKTVLANCGHQGVLVPIYPVAVSRTQLDDFETVCIGKGFEGVMLRIPGGKYKCGRSTEKEALLLKVKIFEDSECEVLALHEQMTNTNEKEVNELGDSKRSSHLAGMVPANMLGEFSVRDIHTGQVFKVGTGLGLTQKLRREIWANKDSYVGKIFTYTFQPSGGKDLPRFPVFKGFRHEGDMS